jgi:hypothetical protein
MSKSGSLPFCAEMKNTSSGSIINVRDRRKGFDNNHDMEKPAGHFKASPLIASGILT